MSAPGSDTFPDNSAAAIGEEYRELLEFQVPDADATRLVIAAYDHLSIDEQPELWLGLAATQSSLGRLDERVKVHALEVIDTGRGLDQSGLESLREQLTGPQPDRLEVRRPWRSETDLRRGEILTFTATNGEQALLRVARVAEHRHGSSPVLVRLDWSGRSVPTTRELGRLQVLGQPRSLEVARTPDSFYVARLEQDDPDWPDAGFTVAARIPSPASDAQIQVRTHTRWAPLASILETALTSEE